jgi:hypothetical protein
MSRRDTLYERTLKRPLDANLRTAIDREAAERCRHIPFPTECGWDGQNPVYAIRSSLASFFATFTAERLIVTAELSLAARLAATERNRRLAIEMITAVADKLDL